MSANRDVANPPVRQAGKWSRLRRLIVVSSKWLAISLLVLGGYWLVRGWYLHTHGYAQLAEAVAQTNRDFPGWTWRELRAELLRQPDADRGALLLEQLYDKVLAKQIELPFGQGTLDSFTLPWALGHYPGSSLRQAIKARQPLRRPAATNKVLAELEDLRRELHKFRGIPAGGRLDEKAPDFWRMPKHHSMCKLLGQAAVLWALEELAAGRPQQVLEYAEVLLGLANAIRREKFVLAVVLCHELELKAARLVELTLAHEQVPKASLARLHSRFIEALRHPTLVDVLWGERARLYDLMERLDHDPEELQELHDYFAGLEARNPFRGQITWTQRALEHAMAALGYWKLYANLPATRAKSLGYFNQAIRLAELPGEQFLLELGRFEMAWRVGPAYRSPWCPTVICLLDFGCQATLTEIYETVRLRQECLEATVLGIAYERYRLKEGRWPARLRQLPAEWLPQLPPPQLEQHLQVFSLPEGLVIWADRPPQFGRRQFLMTTWDHFLSQDNTFLLLEPEDRLSSKRRDL
ncbi:hypothetical protein HRbin36_01615 [bacterium HR36]|nr:hypothetical protein HRbin36_01615 [bacterium HR36]